MDRDGRPLRIGGPHCGVARDSDLGGEVFERMLLTRLPSHGVELEIGLPASRKLSETPPGWNVTLLHPGRGLRWYAAPLAFVPYTLRLLRRGDADLLRGHSVLFTGPSLLLARRLARSSVPIVLQHLHTDPLWRRLEAWVLRHADVVFTISEHSRLQLIAMGVPEERIHVVMPGVRRPERVEPYDAWPADPGGRLLYLSRLTERKRPRVAIETLAELRKRGVDASLVVTGDGPLRPSLERLAGSLGISDRVNWLGTIPEREKWGLYETADVFLFPSALEGFGFVAAEAQTCGLPVIAVRGTSVAEIVVDGETGLLVEGDAQSFADAVERLAATGRAEAMSARAQEASARFDWDRAAAETARILAEVAENRRSQG